MKKIVFSYSAVFVLFCSCGVIKYIDYHLTESRMNKKTETVYYYGKKSPFILENKRIFISCKVNDTTLFLFYDSGLTTGFYEQIPANVRFPKCKRTIKNTTQTYSSSNVSVKNGLKYYNIESDFFNFKKFVGELISISNNTVTPLCVLSNANMLCLGLYTFPKRNDVMLLNFSDTSIAILDSTIAYDTTDFMLIKSHFEGNKIKVCVTVDSIDYYFLFDTGAGGFLFLPKYKERKRVCSNGICDYIYSHLQYEKHKKDNDVSITGFWAKDASGMVNDTVITQQTNTITMGRLDLIEGNLLYTKKSTLPIMGMAFISHFDWIIDRHNKKLYAKKIKVFEYEDYFSSHYATVILDTTLQISLLPIGETKYQLFSIIDSVNGEKVTIDNICQMKELLNKENGFTDNEIVILSRQKTMLLKN
jgi:hypothetical protein